MSFWRKWFGPKITVSEQQLLQRCRGDEAQLERLIQLELVKRPGMSRAAGAQAALDRWSRDR
jgi:hypothetical protein